MSLSNEYCFDNNFNFNTRSIVLAGEIKDGCFAFVSKCLGILEESNKSRGITLEIRSEGGEVYEALAIIGRMRNSPCKITTVGYGQVMSAALAILAAGDERAISRYAWAMHHQAAVELDGSLGDLAAQLKQSTREEQRWAELMEEFTSTPKQAWLELGTTDLYLTPEQCLQYGIVDKIV